MEICKKKTERARTSEVNMTAAVKDIRKQKMTVTEASKHYGILISTLLFRLKRVKGEMGPLDDQEVTPEMGLKNRDKSCKYASHQVFTTADENTLAEYVLTCSKLNYGLTLDATRELAYRYALSLNRKFPESWAKNLKAGKDWVRGFLKRHREISLRKPENTSLARNTSFNRVNLTTYFENMQTIMREHCFPPSRIWNLDETGLSTVLQAPRVLAAASVKQVGQCVSNERGEKVSIVGIVNAAGESIPPVYIFPRKRIHLEYMEGSPEGSMALFNAKGYMNSESFVKTLEHIKAHAKSSKENPILIVLDNHGSHLTLDAIKICRESGIHMITLPPHTSHRTQPLDLTVFGPFKAYCKKAFNAWLTENPGQRITLHNIAHISASAIGKSFSSRNIQSGFASSGVYPLDRSKIFKNLESLENISGPISQATSAVSTNPQVTIEASLDFSEEAHMAVDIPSVVSPPSPYYVPDAETPPNFSAEAHMAVDIPSVVSPPSPYYVPDAETPPNFSAEAHMAGDIPSVVSPPSPNYVHDAETPQEFSGEAHVRVGFHRSSLLAQALDLSVTSPDFHGGHGVQLNHHKRVYPMPHLPLDLSETSPDFHGGHVVQQNLHKRVCPMPHLPLDLSATSLTSLGSLASPTSPAVSQVSHIQLRFGQLEILRPIPNPLNFQKNSRVSRGMCSTIVTGSPELKKKEELERKKGVKKEKVQVKKECRVGRAKTDIEMPKKKRGRPRKNTLSETEMTSKKTKTKKKK